MSTGFCIVLTTFEHKDLAKCLARTIVENKMAACATILPKATSIYAWEGRIEEASEFVLLIKTHQDKAEALMSYIKTNHVYTIPEIIQLPIIGGNQAYLDWVKTSLS